MLRTQRKWIEREATDQRAAGAHISKARSDWSRDGQARVPRGKCQPG